LTAMSATESTAFNDKQSPAMKLDSGCQPTSSANVLATYFKDKYSSAMADRPRTHAPVQ